MTACASSLSNSYAYPCVQPTSSRVYSIQCQIVNPSGGEGGFILGSLMLGRLAARTVLDGGSFSCQAPLENLWWSRISKHLIGVIDESLSIQNFLTLCFMTEQYWIQIPSSAPSLHQPSQDGPHRSPAEAARVADYPKTQALPPSPRRTEPWATSSSWPPSHFFKL